MTAAPWDAGPCLWPDDPADLDRQLAEAAADYWARAGVTRIPPQEPDDEPAIVTVHVIGGVL